ncbi:MAG: glycosyltransferase [Actinobacteria bacterium]|nr:glycosyltransferase [Actinomycetota bacterium]
MKVSLIGKYGLEQLARAFEGLGWTAYQHSDEMILRDDLGRQPTPAPLAKADLYVLVGEHGDARKLPDWAHPLVSWTIDPHFSPGLEWGLGNAAIADLTFVSQKHAVEDFALRGVKARWLPLACGDEPRPIAVTEVYNVTFVGSLGPGAAEDRKRICRFIKERFPSSFIGTAWGEELTQVYGRSKIILNSSWMTTYPNMPPRVFHALTAGKCLLTDECDGLLDLFEEDKDLVVYRNDEDLLAKATELLADDERRNRIAASGHAKAMRDHTMKNRAEQILDQCSKEQLISGR